MLLKLLIIGIGITLKITTATVDLEDLSTGNKEQNQQIPFTTTPSSTISSDHSVPTYRINGTNDITCILIRVDALLTIMYRNEYKENAKSDLYVPDCPDLSGDCNSEYADISSVSIGFKEFVLSIIFAKTPGGERWYVHKMVLTYSTSNPIFLHIDRPGLNVKLSTKENSLLLFPTPIGKSCSCDSEIVTMFSQDQSDKSGHTAKLYLRALKMQSFMYKSSNTWGPTYQCSATGTYRDETTDVAVRLTYAVANICSVTGYGIWRYRKVK